MTLSSCKVIAPNTFQISKKNQQYCNISPQEEVSEHKKDTVYYAYYVCHATNCTHYPDISRVFASILLTLDMVNPKNIFIKQRAIKKNDLEEGTQGREMHDACTLPLFYIWAQG